MADVRIKLGKVLRDCIARRQALEKRECFRYLEIQSWGKKIETQPWVSAPSYVVIRPKESIYLPKLLLFVGWEKEFLSRRV